MVSEVRNYVLRRSNVLEGRQRYSYLRGVSRYANGDIATAWSPKVYDAARMTLKTAHEAKKVCARQGQQNPSTEIVDVNSLEKLVVV